MLLESRVGIDLVEVSRVAKFSEERREQFYRHVFTDSEVKWCKKKVSPDMHLAGRFAAKEAVKKGLLALGEKNIPLNGIEINREDGEAPKVRLQLELKRNYICQVSISHTEKLATAVAVVTQK